MIGVDISIVLYNRQLEGYRTRSSHDPLVSKYYILISLLTLTKLS